MSQAKKARLEALAGVWANAEFSRSADIGESRAEAGAQFCDWLTRKYAAGEYTAADICTIAWHHKQSGGHGLDHLALHPDSAAKNGERHVKKALGGRVCPSKLFEFDVPKYNKNASRREVAPVPVQLLHVKLHEEYCDHEDPVGSMEDEDTFYHEAYTKHPVTVSAKQFGWHWTRILPFALFWDGVVYSKKDSFWALFARNLRTQEQFLLWIIRQRLRYIPACPMDMDGHGQSMRQKIALADKGMSSCRRCHD